MTERSYRSLSAELHARSAVDRIPIQGTIEVTHRCPLACSHCYVGSCGGSPLARTAELSFDEHCRIIDEIVEAGCLWLLFTGGEIFARRDFLDIYRHAKRAGLLITLFTGGTLITPEIADVLAEWRPFAIEVTLYGHSREVYERLTGVRGSHERCLRGIRLLRQRGLPLKLKTVVMAQNRHELGKMRAFAQDELGLDFKFDANLFARIDHSKTPLALRLTPEEVVELDLLDERRAGEWKQRGARSHEVAARGCETLYVCGGGVAAFSIDPSGQLSLCLMSRQDKYDLRRGSFQEGWQSFLREVRTRKPETTSKCRGCSLKALCGMCPASGELENNHPELPVDFLCRVAHLRALVFDIAIVPHGPCEYDLGGARYDELRRSAEVLLQRVRSASTTRGLSVSGSGPCA